MATNFKRILTSEAMDFFNKHNVLRWRVNGYDLYVEYEMTTEDKIKLMKDEIIEEAKKEKIYKPITNKPTPKPTPDEDYETIRKRLKFK